jgi:hypothetical protein
MFCDTRVGVYGVCLGCRDLHAETLAPEPRLLASRIDGRCTNQGGAILTPGSVFEILGMIINTTVDCGP